MHSTPCGPSLLLRATPGGRQGEKGSRGKCNILEGLWGVIEGLRGQISKHWVFLVTLSSQHLSHASVALGEGTVRR